MIAVDNAKHSARLAMAQGRVRASSSRSVRYLGFARVCQGLGFQNTSMHHSMKFRTCFKTCAGTSSRIALTRRSRRALTLANAGDRSQLRFKAMVLDFGGEKAKMRERPTILRAWSSRAPNPAPPSPSQRAPLPHLQIPKSTIKMKTHLPTSTMSSLAPLHLRGSAPLAITIYDSMIDTYSWRCTRTTT
jgi:hypothetical protein